MSKILISGCGISWSKQTAPTWVKVLKLCGLEIDDQCGPAISNSLITNNILNTLQRKSYTHVICQLTSMKKLDVEITDPERNSLWQNDPIRNFVFNNHWPSSNSEEHEAKKIYYKWLYSPTIEQDDIIMKLNLIQRICEEKNIKLLIIQGYHIDWKNDLIKNININDYIIYPNYKNSEFFDEKMSAINHVPNKQFQIYLAKKIQDEFLRFPIDHKIKKFDETVR